MTTDQIQNAIKNPKPPQAGDTDSKDILPYILSGLTGFIVCLAISVITGRKEAWDHSSYFSIGLPLMCFAIFYISFKFPVKSWRWAFSLAVGQSVAILMGGNSLSLWPLSIFFMSIISLPMFIAGFVGSQLSSRKINH